ncbi:MAG: TonB-dependent receptor [Acidobacteria bacterium]|nr:TonB-dependent receptor [Acidobacteriota bacterium]
MRVRNMQYPKMVLAVMMPMAAMAQGTTATFYGVVQDASGGAVAGAEAVLRHEATGVSRSQAADAGGEFAFQFLDVGVYTLRISAPGFKSYENTALELRAGQQARQTFRLEVGQVTERVQVTAETPLVNTVTAEQRESLSRKEIGELPVGRRDLSRVMSIGTGISRVGDTGEFILNGLGRAAASFTMDGIDASANPQAPQVNMKEGHNNIAVVTMEAVEEVQVSKGVFSAEFGRALSGNVNVVTKSGTNELHGSLFELFNAEELNGRSQFLRTRPGVTFNQFGGSLGGPVRRDKIFLFGAYEGYQDRSFVALQENVPSPRLRAAMLARVPEYKLFLDGYPLPNQPAPEAAATGAFIGAGTQSGKDNHLTVKPDWWITIDQQTHRDLRSRPSRPHGSSRLSHQPAAIHGNAGAAELQLHSYPAHMDHGEPLRLQQERSFPQRRHLRSRRPQQEGNQARRAPYSRHQRARFQPGR